jgi:hypothetical protein
MEDDQSKNKKSEKYHHSSGEDNIRKLTTLSGGGSPRKSVGFVGSDNQNSSRSILKSVHGTDRYGAPSIASKPLR